MPQPITGRYYTHFSWRSHFFSPATTTAVSMWLISSLLSLTLPFLPPFFLGLKRGFVSQAGVNLMASIAVTTVAEKAIASRYIFATTKPPHLGLQCLQTTAEKRKKKAEALWCYVWPIKKDTQQLGTLWIFYCVGVVLLTGHTVVRPKLNVFVYIIHAGEQHLRSFWAASCLRWTRANNATLTCVFTSHQSGWDGNRHVAGISRVWVSSHVHTTLQRFHIRTIPLCCEDEELEMCLFLGTSDWEPVFTGCALVAFVGRTARGQEAVLFSFFVAADSF